MRPFFNSIYFFSVLAFSINFYSCIPENPEPSKDSYIISGPQDLNPSFSPDGEKIVYFHNSYTIPEPVDYVTGLYIIDKDGQNRKLVLAGNHYLPDWSADGEWIVFSSQGILQKCKPNGDSITTFNGINGENEFLSFPSWSKDGKNIFFSNVWNPNGGIHMVSNDFSKVSRPFGLEIVNGSFPSLSPQGNKFLFVKGDQELPSSEIFIVDTLTLSENRLTNNSTEDLYPNWSPDGFHIIFSKGKKLTIIETGGDNERQIGYGNDPFWSSDNLIVYSFANSDFSKEVLFTYDPNGFNIKQITQ